MTRLSWLCAALAACSHPRAASVFPPGGGTCPDPAGCSATIDHEQHYALPDGDHGAPPDPATPTRPAPPAPGPRLASCAQVGGNLASIELGNYAEPDQLRPATSRWTRQCERLKLDASERLCAFDAASTADVTWCAPRLIPGPELPVVDASQCQSILAQMRGVQVAPAVRDQHARALGAVEASCAADHWPVAFAQCMRSVPDPGYIASYCYGTAPAPLFHRIADRIGPVASD